MRAHEREHGVELRAVVLNCSGMNIVDLSGIENMLELRDTLTERGILLAVMVVKDSALDQLSASGFFDSVQYINGTDDLREFCEAMEK
jgi:anti-anti-sigma regulatory factor